MKTDTGFDLERLREAIEHRDAEGLLAMYAPDAKITIVDQRNPPSAPQVLQGGDQIRAFIEDICSREMSHAVPQAIRDENGAAYTEICRYPDGVKVLCASMVGLSEGGIARQTVVQAWDQ